MPQEQEQRERLEAAADNREVRRRVDHLERYLAHLRIARHHFGEAGMPGKPNALEQALAEGSSTLEGLSEQIGGRIQGRRRPSHTRSPEQPDVLVFIDECGSPRLHASANELGAFVLGAVLVDREEYAHFEATWNDWKRVTFGRPDVAIHEPNVRRGSDPFWFGGDRRRRRNALTSLRATIAKLNFAAIAIVIRRDGYVTEFGHEGVNAILPENPYLLALDFLCERLVLALDQHFDGGKGRLTAEARGPLEDARLQQEFARLHIDGTTYISASWFRQQLVPGIQFGTKGDRMAGLEVADLLCRPCAEKVLDPQSTPDRWPEFRAKLCTGIETAHAPLGIKVFPWSEEYEGFWAS